MRKKNDSAVTITVGHRDQHTVVAGYRSDSNYSNKLNNFISAVEIHRIRKLTIFPGNREGGGG